MRNSLRCLAALSALAMSLSASGALGQQLIPFRSNLRTRLASSGLTAGDANPFVAEDSDSTKDAGPKASARPAGKPAAASLDCGCGCKAPCVPKPDPICGGDCDKSCKELCGVVDCDACPGYGLAVFSGFESFRSVVDGTYTNNNGMVVGGNIGFPLPRLREYGIGAQLGASYGAYDLNGRFPVDGHESEVQQQIFVTAGLFRRASEEFPVNMGVAYDWMLNNGYGVFATSPTLTQLRLQSGYCLSPQNEVGVWSAFRCRGATKVVFDTDVGADVDALYRPLSQVNFFWHHNFDSGADSWLYFGIPDQTRLDDTEGGTLGDFNLGLAINVPLTERAAIYANGQYMKPSASAGWQAAAENAYSIGFGLAFYPRGSSRTKSVAGNCWMPYMPMANNGNFLVDTNILK